MARGQMPATTARMMPAEGSRRPKSLSRLTKGGTGVRPAATTAGVVTVWV